jgi:3-oxoacyl-[acyl-carrier protein] reductase
MNTPQTHPQLAGKRALVTGASGALGSAIARELAKLGAHVLLHAHSRPQAVEDLALELSQLGGSGEPCVFDITDAAAAQDACEQMLQAGARCKSL